MEEKTNCSLFALPGIADLQELILHHLDDAEARREAALVCREFYESICRLEKNKSLTLNHKVSLRGVLQFCNQCIPSCP